MIINSLNVFFSFGSVPITPSLEYSILDINAVIASPDLFTCRLKSFNFFCVMIDNLHMNLLFLIVFGLYFLLDWWYRYRYKIKLQILFISNVTLFQTLEYFFLFFIKAFLLIDLQEAIFLDFLHSYKWWLYIIINNLP